MKKRIIVTLLTAVIVCGCLTGCGETTETINSTKTETAVGSYSIFRTTDAEEYLDFLDNFDESRYEIIDISASMWAVGGSTDEFYIVTYKTIE